MCSRRDHCSTPIPPRDRGGREGAHPRRSFSRARGTPIRCRSPSPRTNRGVAVHREGDELFHHRQRRSSCSSTSAQPPHTESSAPPWEERGALPQNVGNRRPASPPPPLVLLFPAKEWWCGSIPAAATNAFCDPESASALGLLCRGRRERRPRA
jgi:hypothetical protein